MANADTPTPELQALRAQVDALARENAALREDLAELAENIEAAIWIRAVSSGKMIYVNPAYETIWGRSRQSLYDDPASWLDAVIEADRPSVEAALALRRDGNFAPESVITYRIRHPDGHARWIRSRAFPIYDAQGALMREVGVAEDVTDRQQTQEALWRALLEALPIGVCLTDENGRYTLANETYCDIYDFERDEILGQHFSAIMPVEQIEIAEAHYQRLLNGDVGIPVIRKRQRKDGSPITIEAENALVTRADGSKQVITVVKDITDRHEAESALAAREQDARAFQERLKALHEINIELSQSKTLDDLYRRAIELGRDRLGFDRLGLWLQSEDELDMIGTFGIDPEGRVRDERHLRRAIKLDPVMDQAIRSKARVTVWRNKDLVDTWQEVGHGSAMMASLWNGDRSIGWITADNLISGAAMRDYEPELITLYGATLGHLITLKRAEDTLRSNNAILAQAQRIANLGSWEAIFETGELIWSKQMYRIFGLEPPADQTPLRFEQALEKMHPEDAARLRQLNRHQLAAVDSIPPIEYRVIWPDGTQRTVHAVSEIVRDADGQPVKLIGIAQDITARKQAEQQNLELAMERERGNLLHQFIHSASHDLNTPLTAIKTSVYFLKQIAQQDPMRRHVAILDAQTTRLERLFNDMLQMSRLELATSFRFSRLDLRLLLEGILAEQRPLITRKRHVVRFDPASDLPDIIADKTHLDGALSNVITNALQYTPDGGAIDVRAYRTADEVIVEVRDNGPGISDDDLPRIFELFYRADPARGAGKGGAGLGLAIAKKAVEAHQGRIEVETAVDVGSVFRIYLPIAIT